MPSNLNDSFWKWFNGSRVVNRDGSPLVMYHGHVGPAFSSFDPAKIKAVDTDAPFNGFWFSADHNTSPAFRDAHGIMPVYLAIRNPAPWQVWRKVAKEVMQDHRENKLSERSRSVNDEVRYRLADMGHDGILFSHSPDIDAEELERTGRTEFRSVRGSRHSLRKETRPEMVWGDTTDTHTYPEAEVIRKDGTREPLKMDLTSVATLVASTPGADVKDFNFSTLEGTIVLPNGDRIESKLVTKDFPTKDWIHTGRATWRKSATTTATSTSSATLIFKSSWHPTILSGCVSTPIRSNRFTIRGHGARQAPTSARACAAGLIWCQSPVPASSPVRCRSAIKAIAPTSSFSTMLMGCGVPARSMIQNAA